MGFHWESTVFAIIAFVLLYWLLNKYAFGPLLNVMEKRREMIQSQIQSADSNRKEAEKLMSEQKQAILEARKEAQEIIEQARQMSVKQAEEIVQAARDESNRIKDEAIKDIANEKDKAVAALRSQVSAMAVMIASKIIEKQIDEKSQQQLIDQYLKEVGGKL
ncbi:F0F1 ATP synthase subunit B [Paenibacillus sp. J2TS4]|uniref:F0F1 ATP synthase subunit B n=1 Tax=Paenibacillus sp. J2TS4 TaxID=2807194 RepID=UPI001B1C446E|nr:F0F1 ATP synthase subunit B [Paenibacillus sp. J2TS4]GIP35548.1 ATP synthase subunit b [Paenibacillus sp. J2TS4]